MVFLVEKMENSTISAVRLAFSRCMFHICYGEDSGSIKRSVYAGSTNNTMADATGSDFPRCRPVVFAAGADGIVVMRPYAAGSKSRGCSGEGWLPVGDLQLEFLLAAFVEPADRSRHCDALLDGAGLALAGGPGKRLGSITWPRAC